MVTSRSYFWIDIVLLVVLNHMIIRVTGTSIHPHILEGEISSRLTEKVKKAVFGYIGRAAGHKDLDCQ